MKKTVWTAILFLFLLSAFPACAAAADSGALLFSEADLDQLLAPIALYPDPLLAVMLPAATYPAEIEDAESWFEGGGTVAGIDGKNWDDSVKAVAYYRDVLKLMADNPDWTADIGDAFLNQPDDVTRSIQRLRWQARDKGSLDSNDRQQVIVEGDTIAIDPAQPQYIYVPEYDPAVVYTESWVYGMPPVIFFGPRLPIGGWLCLDFDWPHRHVIYHGWNRPGWVSQARPYVRVPNVYVNRSRPSINQTWRHDRSRGDPEKFRATWTGRAKTPGRVQMPAAGGRAPEAARPAGTVFGPRGDARTFSDRGRQSLGTIGNRQQSQPGTGNRPHSPTGTGIRQQSPAGTGIRQQSPTGESVGQQTQPRAGIRTPSPAPAFGRRDAASPDVSRRTPSTPDLSGRPSPAPDTARRPSPSSETARRPSPSSETARRTSPAPETARRTSPAPDTSPRPQAPSFTGTPRVSTPSPARESVQPPRTSSGVFGGYRGNNEAAAQSERGRTSRQSMTESRPSPAPERPARVESRPAPAPSRPAQVESRPSPAPSRPAPPEQRRPEPSGKPGRR